MKISDKIPYAKLHVDSIATHDDTDAGVRIAVLEGLKGYITEQQANIQAQVDAEIDAINNPPPAPEPDVPAEDPPVEGEGEGV